MGEVADIMKFQIEQKGLTLTVIVEDSIPILIHSDQKRLKQVLFNLIGNAVKFTINGGISVKVKAVNSQLWFEVVDTGIGIAEQDIGKLFKFFGQALSSKNINQSGMGLGLTISKNIVQLLGGQIDVHSVPNIGSKFSFWVKLDEAKDSRARE